MAKFAVNQSTETELKDLHNGLHMAMEQFINRKDYTKAETIIRQIDNRLAVLIRTMQVVR